MNNLNEWVKDHCLHTLLGSTANIDPYFEEQIKTAIDFSLTGSIECSAPLDKFARAVIRFLQVHDKTLASRGFHHLDLSEKTLDPLWLREELIRAIKLLAGYEKALLIISGLRSALCPRGKYWTHGIQNRYEGSLNYIDELAAQKVDSSTTLNLIYI